MRTLRLREDKSQGPVLGGKPGLTDSKDKGVGTKIITQPYSLMFFNIC